MPASWRRPADETILHGAGRPPEPEPEAPIYAELARLWQAEGRMVPGLPDPAWEALAGGPTPHGPA
ncbi:hypothetical protein [Streptomyces sp. FH025]|uniref:hypothetical protein n=1 Tax=Streptomyces sp. FH025 TaxID=2815937 RepID=UPI001AA00902|nr:hypothetical protein [Streptomyces sp. FH025]MBO1414404.1 hypothetical protein [Streptomyces sp. FH025]